MKEKKWYQFWLQKRCDNCGKFNPPILGGNPRLCKACAGPKESGRYMYQMENEALATNGKINYWRIQFPFAISWRGWWTF